MGNCFQDNPPRKKDNTITAKNPNNKTNNQNNNNIKEKDKNNNIQANHYTKDDNNNQISKDNTNKNEQNNYNKTGNISTNDINNNSISIKIKKNGELNQKLNNKKEGETIQNSVNNSEENKTDNNFNKKNEEEINNKISILKLNSESNNELVIKKSEKDKIFNSKYTINLKATLKKLISKSDCKVSIYKNYNNDKNLIAESEIQTISKDQVVTFNQNFIVTYDFTQIQPLRIVIKRNDDNEIIDLKLGEIIGKPRQISIHNFPNYNFELEAIMQSEINKEVLFLISLKGDLKGLKPFYSITNLGNRYDNSNPQLVYKSEACKNDSQIIFKQIDLPLDKICEDENLEDSLVEIAFFKDNDQEIGKEKFSINQILNTQNEVNLENNIKANILCQRKNFFNFLQFLYNDFHLVTTFCIDFSANNQVHKKENNFNELLKAFLDILVPYNGDKFFHCYSYGYKLIKTSQDYIDDILPLNRKIAAIEISEVTTKYDKLLNKIKPSRDSNDLGLIIKKLNDTIKADYDLEDKEYNLFIIFACHDVIDEQNFINEILQTCNLNISIVIISIGNDSLKKAQTIIKSMKENLLKRDCIKFMKYSKNINEIIRNSLIDIPDSMIDFFCNNNILPK